MKKAVIKRRKRIAPPALRDSMPNEEWVTGPDGQPVWAGPSSETAGNSDGEHEETVEEEYSLEGASQGRPLQESLSQGGKRHSEGSRAQEDRSDKIVRLNEETPFSTKFKNAGYAQILNDEEESPVKGTNLRKPHTTHNPASVQQPQFLDNHAAHQHPHQTPHSLPEPVRGLSFDPSRPASASKEIDFTQSFMDSRMSLPSIANLQGQSVPLPPRSQNNRPLPALQQIIHQPVAGSSAMHPPTSHAHQSHQPTVPVRAIAQQTYQQPSMPPSQNQMRPYLPQFNPPNLSYNPPLLAPHLPPTQVLQNQQHSKNQRIELSVPASIESDPQQLRSYLLQTKAELTAQCEKWGEMLDTARGVLAKTEHWLNTLDRRGSNVSG